MTTDDYVETRIEKLLGKLDEIEKMNDNHHRLIGDVVNEARAILTGIEVTVAEDGLNANMPQAENSAARNPGEDKGWNSIDVPTKAAVKYPDPRCPFCGVFGFHECLADPNRPVT